MPRPATGELRPLANGFEARIRIDDKGTRKGFALLPSLSEADAAARCRAMASMAQRLRVAGHAGDAVKLLEMAATARPGRPWDAVVAAVDALCAGSTVEVAKASVPAWVAFAKQWISGELRAKWPDHVDAKDSAADERMLRLYVEPVIGELTVDAFTLDHADQVMANLPGHLSSATRRQVAQFVRRVCALAVYPARLLRENPCPRGWMPKVRVTRAFTYLYPEEDRTLLACETVPVLRRLFYGTLAREGLRRDELGGVRWRDVDLDRGRIALDENKTDDPRAWALDAGVLRALSRWRELYARDAELDDYVFAENGCPLYTQQLAAELRDDLKTADVKRPQLFERSAVRRPIRVHDLRASFVTVSLANGRTETWVADRTGHRSSIMINRYRREARTWSELNLGPLAPLDEAIPELRLPHVRPMAAGGGSAVTSESSTISAERRGFEPPVPLQVHMISKPNGEGEETRAAEDSRGGVRSGQARTTPDATAVGRSWGDADPVEAAIAEALRKATEVGRFDVVAQLARELEARRTAGAGNVVALPQGRRRA